MTLLVQCELKARSAESEPELVRVAASARHRRRDGARHAPLQWFVAPTRGHYSILEEYIDAAAAETHNNGARVAALLQELFAAAELVSITFYGELNEYLTAAPLTAPASPSTRGSDAPRERSREGRSVGTTVEAPHTRAPLVGIRLVRGPIDLRY